MSEIDRNEVNNGARVAVGDPADDQSYPHVEVAGVSAYLYLHTDGALRVSLHFEVDPEVFPQWAEAGPVKGDVGGHLVYEVDSDGMETIRPVSRSCHVDLWSAVRNAR